MAGTEAHSAEKARVEGDWIMEALNRAADEWDRQCERTKPLINSPYFAQRAEFCDKPCCVTSPGGRDD